jgi:uncharacterized protein YndB with AHSA1/START domain
MKTLTFSIRIAASPQTVWATLTAPETYKAWTAAFIDGSYFEGSCLTSVIAENRPHEYISIKHLGEVKQGVDDTDSEEVRAWAPLFENYMLSPAGSATEFRVELGTLPGHVMYLEETWPKALARLKAICEKSGS